MTKPKIREKALRKDNPFYATLSPNCLEREASFNRGCYFGYERARKDGLLPEQSLKPVSSLLGGE